MSSNLSALWSHPRSLSTVVERVMSGQGSLTVLHEPFSYLYYVTKHPERAVVMNPDPGRPHRYDSIRDSLLSASKSGPTFFKDMAYHCLDEVVATNSSPSSIIATIS